MVCCLTLLRLTAGFLLVAASALAVLIHAQEPSPKLKRADADYRAGTTALAHNDLMTALADFQAVVQQVPENAQGHGALAAVLLRLGRNSEGIRELEKALALKPGDSTAQLNLAVAYQQNNEAAKALPLFAKLEATARNEKRALPSYVLASHARALAALMQAQAATAKMKQAVACDERNAELHDELGSIYAQQKQWPEAAGEFSTAIQLKPDLAQAHLHLGLAMQTQQQPGALEQMGDAYQLAPRDAMIALEYGQALARGGKDEQALPVLQSASELDPASITTAYQLGLVLQRLNRVQDSISLLQRAAGAEPDNAEVQINFGMALCLAQRAKDAVPILQHAVALTSDNATAHQNLAVAYIQLSQFDDAIIQLRAALKLSPDAPQLHYNLGFALKSQDDAAGTIPELETAEKLDPSAPEAPYLLGVLYMQAGRYADASRELNASLKLRPENGDGWATLGSVYNRLEQLPEAVMALHEAIRQSPEQPDPHLTLAAVLAKQNQTAEAAAERKTAAELMRAHMNRQRAEVATNSANSALKNSKVEDAIAGFREALSYDSNYAEAHLGLADALARQGKSAEAAAERSKAQALEHPAQ